MKICKIISALFLGVCLQTVQAAGKVLAIPIPQISSFTQTSQMIEKELPKSLDFLSPKIVGGVTAGRNNYPEFGLLWVDGLDGFIYSVCGASLISNNKVLTAAHCTSGIGASRFYVLPNFYSFNDNITFGDLIPVSRKNQHPNYQQSTAFNNDVTVLTLSENSNAPKAKLFAGKDQLVGSTATIIGVGVTSEGGTSPQTLRKVEVPIVSNNVCKQSYGNSSITDSMLCAGLTTGGKDSCQGDSGGPLWVDFNGEKVQAGIVSWGNGCARPNFYGVYARTSALIDFIRQYAPNTEFVEEKSGSILPIIQMLLLDDSEVSEIVDLKATQIAGGNNHSCASLSVGKIMCWGNNFDGQLGNGTTTGSTRPVYVTGINNATSVSAGWDYSCALLSSGQIKCWGENKYGQLGNGNRINNSTPVLVSNINNASAITSDDEHTCALLNTGQVKCWGKNFGGQLGTYSNIYSTIPMLVDGINNAIEVVAGTEFNCSLLSSGQITCWGYNAAGLGNGVTTSSVSPILVKDINDATAIAASQRHACSVLADGKTKCWGRNIEGQLGNGDTINSSIPVLVSEISNATHIAAGYRNSCVRMNTGQVKCWGSNTSGQLGTGNTTDSLTPVLVRNLTNASEVEIDIFHACSLLGTGKVMCWGRNLNGELGNGTNTNSTIPVLVSF